MPATGAAHQSGWVCAFDQLGQPLTLQQQAHSSTAHAAKVFMAGRQMQMASTSAGHVAAVAPQATASAGANSVPHASATATATYQFNKAVRP